MVIVTGTVVEAWTGIPVDSAIVMFRRGFEEVKAVTSSDGSFTVHVKTGTYEVTVLHRDYETYRSTVTFDTEGMYTMRIELKPRFRAL